MTFDARPERTSHRPGDDVVILVDSVVAQRVSVVVTHLGDEVRRSDDEVAVGRTRVSLGASAKAPSRSASPPPTARRPPPPSTSRRSPGAATLRVRHRLPARTRRRRRGGRLAARIPPQRRPVLRLDVPACALLPPSDGGHLPLAGDFVDALTGHCPSRPSAAWWTPRTPPVPGDRLRRGLRRRREYADEHPEDVLHRRDGRPWMLGDFLWIMDVSRDSAWSRHVVAQMGAAVRRVGFDGLHLDQYGDPKVAVTGDGDGCRPRGRVRGAHRGRACGAPRCDADLQQRQRLSHGDDCPGADRT